MVRRRSLLIALCVLAVLVGGWALLRTNQPAPTTSSRSDTSSGSDATSDGLPTCALNTLPAQVAVVVRAIHSNGPFPYPRNDGVVFGNREGHLPDEAKGYYHEYTVITPGAQSRATRRIITGGMPTTDPQQYYYTADHYDSFCLVLGAGRQS